MNYLTIPWENLGFGAFWLMLMAFLVALPCSQMGSFLILRRMSLTGDAISHSVFPGVVIAFVFTGDLASPWLIIGAGLAGLASTVFIELIHKKTRVKQDAATGISFTALFALGVVLMETMLGKNVDLDLDCVLHGRLGLLLEEQHREIFGLMVPQPILIMAGVALLTIFLMMLFYRVLLLSAFDQGLAASYGYKPAVIHYCTMFAVSFIVVAAFQAVGAILVIALLILPGAAAYLCTHRLKIMLLLASIHALLSAVGGLYLHVWFNTDMASAVVVSGGVLLILAWLLGPVDGLMWKWLKDEEETPDKDASHSACSE
ncbi:metal ABC transporter permease [Verrucomicrobiaceae bacterium R5-34]|uniref:Metal ABC transporter permease n=1 Tax=Oceaniferula flava TaxID=2800421 RepID=A0AAE2SBF1_9BACT|nr:metal ABC transporter permease [Oceaniferula flavus]MBK1830089.1 metal ABC transporter permease [Verrucomicrobiaceae bacterium R5-34]MBK1855065.1 metal ABC transporter permease [Oceaniferula flavus]MBM1136371.1 metal ABC transporter permease [Oceaniferula flavus]